MRRNLIALGQFLGGRLAGYLVFALAAWLLNRSLVRGAGLDGRLIGIVYISLALFLIWYVLSPRLPMPCAMRRLGSVINRLNRPLVVPVLAGFLSGVVLCPPFLLALAEAATKRTLLQTMFFFVMFFVGTSVFLLPLPLTGFVRRFEAMTIIGRLSGGIVGLCYLYTGVFLVIG